VLLSTVQANPDDVSGFVFVACSSDGVVIRQTDVGLLLSPFCAVSTLLSDLSGLPVGLGGGQLPSWLA
jgi:hypothetical protein